MPTYASLGLIPTVLLIGLLGVPLFGMVAAIVLIMFFVSAISTSARSRDPSPRLGLMIAFLALAILTLLIIGLVR